MIRRLARDESGITMGLTVIMIVLIGIMGAGLLTFVQNDLGTVIESNQGQTAFNLADAGSMMGALLVAQETAEAEMGRAEAKLKP